MNLNLVLCSICPYFFNPCPASTACPCYAYSSHTRRLKFSRHLSRNPSTDLLDHYRQVQLRYQVSYLCEDPSILRFAFRLNELLKRIKMNYQGISLIISITFLTSVIVNPLESWAPPMFAIRKASGAFSLAIAYVEASSSLLRPAL